MSAQRRFQSGLQNINPSIRNDQSSSSSTASPPLPVTSINGHRAGNGLPVSVGSPISIEEMLRLDPHCSPPPLQIGERIVWPDDKKFEFGVVKWIGKLPDQQDMPDEWMVGVEFDNKVGMGTGLYRTHQLFLAQMGHAGIMPANGLMKSGDVEHPDQPSANTTVIPHSSFSPSSASSIQSKGRTTRSMKKEFESNSELFHNSAGHFRDYHQSTMNSNDSRNKYSNGYAQTHRSANDNISSDHFRNNENDFQTVGRSSSGHSLHQSPRMDQTDSNFRGGLSRQALGLSLSENKPYFGDIQCEPLGGYKPPLSDPDSLKDMIGRNRGIQGHHNSCYMDATLFAMFAYNYTFDSLLIRPQAKSDIAEYGEVQRVLKENIVNPLRARGFVRADRVMELRRLLDKLSSVRGLTSEEKDPEEFLNMLLGDILVTEPYLKLSTGLESFLYQLIVEKGEKFMPSVQDLFNQSFFESNLKLNEVPNCLLLQLPRYGKQYKLYNRILPSLELDITDVMTNRPRQCTICSKLALMECQKCFNRMEGGLENTAFCKGCYEISHQYLDNFVEHQPSLLKYSPEIQKKFHNVSLTPNLRVRMELFAVLCIQTSHYVCFVKCGRGSEAKWCFFDSMADRIGEENGYNIPEVRLFEHMDQLQDQREISRLDDMKDDKNLPEMTRRLLCDAYMCFYRNPDLELYR